MPCVECERGGFQESTSLDYSLLSSLNGTSQACGVVKFVLGVLKIVCSADDWYERQVVRFGFSTCSRCNFEVTISSLIICRREHDAVSICPAGKFG